MTKPSTPRSLLARAALLGAGAAGAVQAARTLRPSEVVGAPVPAPEPVAVPVPTLRGPRRKLRAGALTVGIVGLLAMGGIALGATLGTSSGTLGAGSTTVAACQKNAPIAISYTPPAATASPSPDIIDSGAGFVLQSVTLTGIETTCASKTVYLTVIDSTATNKVLATGTAAIPAGITPTTALQVALRVPNTATPTTVPVGASSAPSPGAAGVNLIDVLIPN